MTACAATFGGDTRADAALRDRVVYVCAMSGAWDGAKNLLGCCFNNAVDYAATEACCAPGFFPRGRFVMVPTETCKMGPFTLTREHVASAAAHEDRRALQAVLRDDIGQWTDLKRGETQALFDAVPVLPLHDLATHVGLVEAQVVFGKNRFAKGTRYEDLGVSLRNTGRGGSLSHDLPLLQRTKSLSDFAETPLPVDLATVPGRVMVSSCFPGGHMYATERVFSAGCGACFTGMVEDILAMAE
jgi:hypothetical protein